MAISQTKSEKTNMANVHVNVNVNDKLKLFSIMMDKEEFFSFAREQPASLVFKYVSIF